jgi:citronellol/citronellal dehydrogenase
MSVTCRTWPTRVIYLSAPSGKFVTGELLTVDGGGVLWGEVWTIAKPDYFKENA